MNANLVPERLTWPAIWYKAEEFRQRYVDPVDTIPLPIEKIIETKMGLEIRPIVGMKSAGIEALLLNDLRSIIVDNDAYLDERLENRFRFTLAHELGHLMLHPDITKGLRYRTIRDYINHRLGQNTEDLDWFERQASEFAGRLLVPRVQLDNFLQLERDRIEIYLKSPYGSNVEMLQVSLSRILCDKFGVSDKVIQRRFISEKIRFE
ncbi:MAG TPA: ImmA/IrrE family metallo-endopeptidase [Bacteroidales bacterium]|nr:ImmA/IrrE family metallo-endopeptidase [Bacteroidales bacterium]